MYSSRKLSDLLLHSRIKLTLVDPVCHNSLPQLAAGHMMEHKTLLAGVNHLAVIQSLKLLSQLGLLGQLSKHRKHRVIHRFGSIIIDQSLSHGNTVALHTLCPAFPGHHLNQIHLLCL